jgi:GH25 family lysozyme M1 (1,4-beta-N-acetylmuramidase)
MAQYAGIDISYCQPIVDYTKVKNGTISGSKIKYVMVRSGYSTTEDKYFKTHVDGCLKAGLNVGIYHYSKAKNAAEAKKEAEFVISLIKKYGYDGKITYPIAYDLEETFQAALGSTICTAMCKAFCDTIKSYNYYPIIYTNFDWLFWSKKINYESLKEYPFWVAGYINPTKAEPYLSKIAIWQHSVAGHPSYDIAKIGAVPGISGQCDCDISYVAFASKIKSLGMNKFKTKTPTYSVEGKATGLTSAKADQLVSMLKANGFTVTKTEES